MRFDRVDRDHAHRLCVDAAAKAVQLAGIGPFRALPDGAAHQQSIAQRLDRVDGFEQRMRVVAPRLVLSRQFAGARGGLRIDIGPEDGRRFAPTYRGEPVGGGRLGRLRAVRIIARSLDSQQRRDDRCGPAMGLGLFALIMEPGGAGRGDPFVPVAIGRGTARQRRDRRKAERDAGFPLVSLPCWAEKEPRQLS